MKVTGDMPVVALAGGHKIRVAHIPMEALAPFRVPFVRPEGDPQPLPYLDSPSNRAEGALDIQLQVDLQTPQMRASGQQGTRISRTSYRHAYWTAAQLVAHHTVNGCNLQPGDLLARSNFTDDKGTTALGKNARVAYMAFDGRNFEDAFVISKSFAKRFSSEHMYQHGQEWEDTHKKGKNAFVSIFPSTYDRKMLERFGDDGTQPLALVTTISPPGGQRSCLIFPVDRDEQAQARAALRPVGDLDVAEQPVAGAEAAEHIEAARQGGDEMAVLLALRRRRQHLGWHSHPPCPAIRRPSDRRSIRHPTAVSS